MQPSSVHNNQSTFVVVGCFGAGALRGVRGNRRRESNAAGLGDGGWEMVEGTGWRKILEEYCKCRKTGGRNAGRMLETPEE